MISLAQVWVDPPAPWQLTPGLGNISVIQRRPLGPVQDAVVAIFALLHRGGYDRGVKTLSDVYCLKQRLMYSYKKNIAYGILLVI